MFDSGVTANDFISALKSETDIAPDIPDSYYIDWINGVEQTLYDNVVREEAEKTLSSSVNVPGGTDSFYVALSDFHFTSLSGESPIVCDGLRFEDVVSVQLNNSGVLYNLAKVSYKAGKTGPFTNVYWKYRDYIGIKIPKSNIAQTVMPYIECKLRPIPKATNNINTQHIMVSPEYLDMVRAKVRGEAYKFANEDALAAKWLNDYNQQLEYFRAWIASNKSTFGA